MQGLRLERRTVCFEPKSRRSLDPTVNRLEVDDGGGTAEIEEVLANAAVARAASLLAADVCESMFDGDALAQSRTALRAGDESW